MSGGGLRIWGAPELPEPEPFAPRDFLAADTGLRNGLPALTPYTWRPGEAEREAEVRAQIAAARARVREARADRIGRYGR